MQIQIKIQNNYGRENAYPVCDKAIIFAKMLNSKTLTHAALCHIEALGYEVVIKQPEFKTFKQTTKPA
jgi:hypothetical protein